MKGIILTIFVFSCTSVFGFDIHSTIYQDFPNECSDDVEMPAAYTRIGKKYYYIEATEKLCWFGAAHSCHRHNATLATIETTDDMKSLSQHLFYEGYMDQDMFWTAGNDLAIEGQFRWLTTGKPMVYTKWSTGQPDKKSGDKNCVNLSLRGDEFYMNNSKCKEKYHYICEMDTPKTIAITIW